MTLLLDSDIAAYADQTAEEHPIQFAAFKELCERLTVQGALAATVQSPSWEILVMWGQKILREKGKPCPTTT